VPSIEATEFQQATEDGAWRVLDGRAQAWFEAPSHAAGAALVQWVAATGPMPEIDLRSSGLRVRLRGCGDSEVQQAAAISRAARELGLGGDPSALQAMGLVVEAADPAVLMPFWRTVLGYRADGARLVDPWQRDPAITFLHDSEARPLRNRLHVDVVRPPEAVAAAVVDLGQTPTGPYGALLCDRNGNEVDLVVGGPMSDGETSDWVAAFAAMAAYPTSTPVQAAQFVAATSEIADEAGFPLLIDARTEGVVVDSGKDMWEGPDGPLEDFVSLAAEIQDLALRLGLMADPIRPRFVQLCLDVADVATERAFWASLLGYEEDPRDGVADILDPRRLNPVVIFQRIDVADEARMRQRDRMRIVLSVPFDRVEQRIDTATAVGGSAIRIGPGFARLSDPEGNELDLVYTS